MKAEESEITPEKIVAEYFGVPEKAIRGRKSMLVQYIKDYHQSQLQALKQRLDDYKAHPIIKRRNGEEFKLHGFISIEEAKRIITNLEDNE